MTGILGAVPKHLGNQYGFLGVNEITNDTPTAEGCLTVFGTAPILRKYL